MVKTARHRSHRFRLCESCRGSIKVGDLYLTHVASPDHDDLGNTHWWRTSECADCARRYGRGALIDGPGPISEGDRG